MKNQHNCIVFTILSKLPFLTFYILIFSFNLSHFSLLATDHAQNYQSGKQLADSQNTNVNLNGVNQLKDYAGDNVPQKSFADNRPSLINQGQSALNTSELGQFLVTTQNERPLFKDLEKDGYFIEADKIVTDPLKFIEASTNQTSSSDTVVEQTNHTCIEGREDSLHTCKKRRIIRLQMPPSQMFQIQVYFYNHGQRSPLGINFLTGQQLDGVAPTVSGGGYAAGRWISLPMPADLQKRIIRVHSCQINSNFMGYANVHLDGNGVWTDGNWAGQYVGINVEYLPQSTILEEIEDQCAHLEDQADKGICTYESKRITDGAGSKTFLEVINGKNIGEIVLHRDWWEEEYTYSCQSCAKDTCAPLRAKGCLQTGSKCNKMVNGKCLEYLQTFICEKKRLGNGQVSLSGPVPYCLDGNCDNHQWVANGDMAEALSRLAIFKELQKDMDANSQIVFKGDTKQCRKDCLSFRDCCGKGKGWGKNFGYKCSSEEQALSLLRSENKCVQVGTYCAKKEKLTGKCLTKKTSFCCFQTKLSKLIHEQGRAQLNISWGSPEQPNCRALRVNELSRIDFSKLDLSSLYADIYANMKLPDLSKITTEIKHNIQFKIPKSSSQIKQNLNIKQSDNQSIDGTNNQSSDNTNPSQLQSKPAQVNDDQVF